MIARSEIKVVSLPAPIFVKAVVKTALSGNLSGASCCRRKSFDMKSCLSVGESGFLVSCLRLDICSDVNCTMCANPRVGSFVMIHQSGLCHSCSIPTRTQYLRCLWMFENIPFWSAPESRNPNRWPTCETKMVSGLSYVDSRDRTARHIMAGYIVHVALTVIWHMTSNA